MLVLAERLRESNGGVLDDSAIQAVAEATGTHPDYVRIAVHLMPEKKRSVFSQFRSASLQIDPDTRRFVLSALMGTVGALAFVFSVLNSKNAGGDFFSTLELIAAGIGLWNVSLSKDSRTAAMTGAIGTGTFFVAQSLFAYLTGIGSQYESALLVVFLVLGALLGVLSHKLVDRHRSKLGITDPRQERQQLLSQLVALQDKLRSGEQSITFVSVDIVGSTQMKANADPLSVEFTFNEYHQFVEMITHKFGGRVHSTAGDGLTLAFDVPQQAFAAARNLQSGLIELNTYRNKIGTPITLRVGVHTGTVVAPTAGDIKSINFAHVIDMAAHIQKAAPPGGVAVSETTCMYLPGGSANVGVETVTVLDKCATIWTPRKLPVSLTSLPPTPLS